MDFCWNISVSGGVPANYQPEQQLLSPSSSCSKLCSLDDLFSGHSMEEGDVNMEWLSIFVEDCLSSSGNCLPPAAKPQSTTSTAQGTPTSAQPKVKESLSTLKPQSTNSTVQGTTTSAQPKVNESHSTLKPQSTTSNAQGTTSSVRPTVKKGLSTLKLLVPCKARSKRKRIPTCWSQQYPPLLQQAYWLADSELILPKKCTTPNSSSSSGQEEGSSGQGQGRKCTHCLSQRTPQWRAGPQGPKTLCNACGVRYKSGRLLPEYRPAKSPTFVSYKHSNSHKKVLEMRMSLLPSSSSSS